MELSIEQKAKAYDEALEIAKEKKSKCNKAFSHIEVKKILEDIFPVLKESDDDRIKNALIDVLKSDFENDTTIHGITVRDIIAWVEKQKSIEHIEHQYPSIIEPALNDYLCKTYAALEKENGGKLSFARLQHLGIDICEWQKKQKQAEVQSKFKVGDCIQYQNMEHNRYIIKEVHIPTHYINSDGKRMDMTYTDANFELVEEIDIELEEENEKIYDDLIVYLNSCAAGYPDDVKFVEKVNTWLKSLRSQNHWKPTEEQMKYLRSVSEKSASDISRRTQVLNELYEQLKQL